MQTPVQYAKRIRNDYVFRTRLSLPVSAAASVVTCCYYLITALSVHTMRWQFGIALWYAVLYFAKLFLIACFARRSFHPIAAAIVTAWFLLALGTCSFFLAQILHFGGVQLTLPNSSIVLNGTIFLSTVSAFSGRRFLRLHTRESAYFRCRKYLARTECLFALILLFVKLIEIYSWTHDSDLLYARYLGGLLISVYALTLCALLCASVTNRLTKK